MSDDTTTVQAEDLDRLERRPDWDRLRKQSDEDVEAAIRSDPDTVLLDADWFETEQVVVPTAEKRRIAIRLDEDIIEHFKRAGDGYQSRINAILKAYVLAQQMNETGEEGSR